jgi:hypothetical protein
MPQMNKFSNAHLRNKLVRLGLIILRTLEEGLGRKFTNYGLPLADTLAY